MLLQLGNGLLDVGNVGVVKCSKGISHLHARHGFLVNGDCSKGTGTSGSSGGNAISRLRCGEVGGGRFNGRCHRYQQPRGSLIVRSSQRIGGRGEDEHKKQQQRRRRNSQSVSSTLKDVGGGEEEENEEPELPAKRSVHFIGIGGAGLSALAFLALQQGWQVSGSDATANDRMTALKDAGATVYVGHAPNYVINPKGLGPPDAIVASSAIPRDNVEIEAAKKAGLPIYRRADWLGMITEGYDVLAVAGSHGKSTTAAMLATMLQKLGDDVTAIVGAEVPQFPGGRNAIYGKGQRFVLEADEYDGCFLGVTPALAVVTNVEWEHVDIFPDVASVRDIFEKFVLRIKPGGTLIVCGDGGGSKLRGTVFRKEEGLEGSIEGFTQRTVPRPDERVLHRVVTFGLDKGNDWQAVMLTPNIQGGTDYVVVHAGRPMAKVSLQVPGTHNVLNSLAALVAVSLVNSQQEIGGDLEDELTAIKGVAEAASKVLAQFVGVRRRFEFVGQVKGCVIIDDYAHHPTEVRAVLQAARQRFDGHSIWVVFQPHTYSRLVSLLQDFAPAFSAADRVIVTEVYSAREENIWNVSGADLAAAITGPPAVFVPSLEDVVERLSWELTVYETMKTATQEKVVLLTLGAGDITNVGSQLLRAFQVTPR